MNTRLTHPFKPLRALLVDPPAEQTVLRLTALMLLLHGGTFNLTAEVALPMFCGAMLVYTPLLISTVAWALIAGAMVWASVIFWFEYDNQLFLMTYWCLACALAVGAPKPLPLLQWNSRLLLGLCFLFGTLWKIMAMDFVDGSLLHLTFLTDSRFELGAWLFGGLSPEILEQNRALLSMSKAIRPGQGTVLQSSEMLQRLSLILSYWTMLIEGAIAIAFLFPYPKWLHRIRNELLIVFIVMLYPVAPIEGFAAILLVLGLAQCDDDCLLIRGMYIILFLLIPLWILIPSHLLDLRDYLTGFS